MINIKLGFPRKDPVRAFQHIATISGCPPYRPLSSGTTKTQFSKPPPHPPVATTPETTAFTPAVVSTEITNSIASFMDDFKSVINACGDKDSDPKRIIKLILLTEALPCPSSQISPIRQSSPQSNSVSYSVNFTTLAVTDLKDVTNAHQGSDVHSKGIVKSILLKEALSDFLGRSSTCDYAPPSTD